MRKKIIVMTLVLCILMIIFSGLKINQAYNTEPTICYDGQKKEMLFSNIKDKDLFTDLKELMPGDRKEQEIIFKAVNIKNNTKVFINISKIFDKNLIQYIKIYIDNREVLNNSEHMEIANFSNDIEIKLKVVVDIPVEAGNELDDLEYSMDWKILIQENGDELIDIPTTNINNPKTYDDIIIYAIIFILSVLLCIYLVIKLRNSKKK